MKKLLSILAATSITATAATSVIACTPTKDNVDYDKLVGMGIDRSNAIDDSDLTNNDLGFTNFYTLGDSLSDYNGLSTLIGTALTNIIDVIDVIYENDTLVIGLLDKLLGEGIKMDLLGVAKVNITGDTLWNGGALTGLIVNEGTWNSLLWPMILKVISIPESLQSILSPIVFTIATKGIKVWLSGISSIDEIKIQFQTGKIDALEDNNAFTDKKPAAVLFAEALGFTVSDEANKKSFNAGVNTNIAGLVNVKTKTPGNNYSIGGATSANVSGMTGLLLNSVQIHDQAEALLKDHKTKPTDLVFLEIGGNDLFGMTGLYDWNNPSKNSAEIEQLMSQAIANIRTALLSLLNNNVKNIIVSNAPDISKIPSYVVYENSSDRDKAVSKKAQELSYEFNKRFTELFNEINSEYGNTMKMFDMATTFDNMLSEFKAGKDGNLGTDDDGIIDKPSVSLGGGFGIDVSDPSIIEIQIKNPLADGIDKDKYFFWDSIHPNSWAHEQVRDILLELADEIAKEQKLGQYAPVEPQPEA